MRRTFSAGAATGNAATDTDTLAQRRRRGARTLGALAAVTAAGTLAAVPALAHATPHRTAPGATHASVSAPDAIRAVAAAPHARAWVSAAIPTATANLTWLGAAGATAPAQALVSIQHRDEAGLLGFINQVSDPKSPRYRDYVSSRQFNARYAPSDATLHAVEAYLSADGLKITNVPANRAFVVVSGTVAQMNRTFATTIDTYERDGRSYQAPTRQLSVPQALKGVITGVSGLDTGDYPMPETTTAGATGALGYNPADSGLGIGTSAVESQGVAAADVVSGQARPHANTASCINDPVATPTTTLPADPTKTPPDAAYVNAPPFSTSFDSCISSAPSYDGQTLGDIVQGYTPSQIESAYGLSGAIAHGLNGTGETVAIIDAYSSPYVVADAAQYSKNMGLPAPVITLNDNAAEEDSPDGPDVPSDSPILGGAALLSPSGWFGEENLDVDAVHTMAPGAKIDYQGATSIETIDQAQNSVVSADQAQEVSNSYGDGGGSEDSADTTSDGYWEQAAAEGMGVEQSTGDDGDNTSCGATPADFSVDGGPNSPYVTGVGGTTLAIGASGQYEWETYWGEKTATLTNGAWGALSCDGGGGGGVSQAYGEPAWQKGVVPTSEADYWQGNANNGSGGTPAVVPGRVLPDVSMVADPNSGFYMGLTQDFSVDQDQGTAANSDSQAYDQYRIGGTSLSSPLFAGVMAVADQAAGKPLGFANPALYALETASPTAFHDPDTTAPVVGVVRTNYADEDGEAGYTASNLQTVLRTYNNLGLLQALKGYDDSTGLGSPNGLAFLCGLAPNSAALKSLSGSPCAATPATTPTTTTTTPTKSKTKGTKKKPVCTVAKTLIYAQHPASPARETKAILSLDGRRVKTIRGRRISVVALKRPKASRFTVTLVSYLSTAEVVEHIYRYDGCKRSTTYKVLHKHV